MSYLKHSAQVLCLLVFIAVGARADIPDCFLFVADPDTYYAPPGDVTYETINGVEYATSWTYSFNVYTTYTNNCSEPIGIGGSFGTDIDPMLAVYFDSVPLTDFYDPFHFFAPGESQTYPFAWYVWSPDAPAGYTWTDANIYAEACTESADCTFVVTQFTAVVTPEPGTLLLFGTGLSALALKLRKARHRKV